MAESDIRAQIEEPVPNGQRPGLTRRRLLGQTALILGGALLLDACGPLGSNGSATETAPFAQEKFSGYFSTGEANSSIKVAVLIKPDGSTPIFSTSDGTDSIPLTDVKEIAGRSIPPKPKTGAILQVVGDRIGVVTNYILRPTGTYDNNGAPVYEKVQQNYIELPAKVRASDGSIKDGFIYIGYDDWANPPVCIVRADNPKIDDPSKSPIMTSINPSGNQSQGINQKLQVSWI